MSFRKLALRALVLILLVAALVVLAAVLILPRKNLYQTTGTLHLKGIAAPVEILRDESGYAYVRAASLEDVLFGQGYATAQDRLFQMHLTRLFAEGRLGEMAGDRTRELDLRMRTYGFARIARKQAALLDDQSRRHFQRYADGVNAMIESGQDLPLEFSLAGIQPEPWTVEDSLAIAFYMSWNSSANLRHEVLTDALERHLGGQAQLLAPLNWNPDLEADPVGRAPAAALAEGTLTPLPPSPEDASPLSLPGELASLRPVGSRPERPSRSQPGVKPREKESFSNFPPLPSEGEGGQGGEGPAGSAAVGEMLAGLLKKTEGWDPAGATALGSNNWAVGKSRSPSGMPIVANDPHLDTRMLPGPWHPVGLLLPGHRAIGATIPGMPGLVIGRSDRVAMGVTNAYADLQDLYVETLDPQNPGHYLDGGASLPFDSWRETFRFKDGDAPGGLREETQEIRATRRGPVVSDVIEAKLQRPAGEIVTLRWAPAETLVPHLGFTTLLTASNSAEIDAELQGVTLISLNFVFADRDGGLGFRVTGRPPRREAGTGTRPTVVDKALPEPDNWQGFLGPDEMPHASSPERDWLGTANHLTAAPGLPYYYTDFAASSYRYRRMKEVLGGSDKLTVDQHWQLQRDTKNLLAERLVPIFVPVLEKAAETGDFAEILKVWNFRDEATGAAPLIFQEMLRQLVLATVKDDLGDELAAEYLDNLYYWQERLESLLVAGDSPFFDDKTTPLVEKRDDLILIAAKEARKALAPRVGSDPKAWQWGQLHTITFVHPLRRSGFGSQWLGTGPLPMSGSAETLLRAWYDVKDPYPVTFMASLRFVADLADDDKMLLVLPGGAVARVFHPHFKDQIAAFMSGEERYMWLSDRALATHAPEKLELRPY